jgi:hypothetical protein
MMKENRAVRFCDSGFAMRFKIIFSVVLMSAAVWSPRVTIAAEDDDRTLYALYDSLDRRAGCAWFWDGDVVPKRRNIDITGLDIHEESAFRYRGKLRKKVLAMSLAQMKTQGARTATAFYEVVSGLEAAAVCFLSQSMKSQSSQGGNK